MRLCAMAHIARDVEADPIADVAFDNILLPRTNHLTVNGGEVGLRPEVARISRIPQPTSRRVRAVVRRLSARTPFIPRVFRRGRLPDARRPPSAAQPFARASLVALAALYARRTVEAPAWRFRPSTRQDNLLSSRSRITSAGLRSIRGRPGRRGRPSLSLGPGWYSRTSQSYLSASWCNSPSC